LANRTTDRFRPFGIERLYEPARVRTSVTGPSSSRQI
jgi:hypothetical protein